MSDLLDMQALMNITDLPGVDGEEVVVYEPLVLTPVVSNPEDRTVDLKSDYVSTRETIHNQREMLMDLAKVVLENAKNSDSPRHIEVFATLMGQVTANSKELLKMHNEMKTITNEQTGVKGAGGVGAINIDKAQVFVGSPADLMNELGGASDVIVQTD